MASPLRLLLVSLVSTLSGVGVGVYADDARISSIHETPAWQQDSLMHLQLTAPETETVQLTYTVFPLTEHAGLNRSDRSSIWIRGSLVAADLSPNMKRLESPETIVFLSCDGENATAEVNEVMAERPKAILLYSTNENCCSLEGDDLTYTSLYTMGDSGEARDTMNNTIKAGGILRATITGSTNTTATPASDQEQSGNNSAVAMSILYSITGLITLLFLVIIGTGAIRAHRYPERYGPRSGYGGRPSQSRARGLARAVLETLPIVKFGDPTPAKPDPALELESQPSATPPDPNMGTRLSAIPEEPRTPQPRRSEGGAPMSGAVSLPGVAEAENETDTRDAPKTDKPDAGADGRPSEEEHLGCSICTEDFTVGEDVRVLPCNHKFHPACIDPWLINISGTCPLCRLDLHPQSRPNSTSTTDPPEALSIPPLAATASSSSGSDDHGSTTTADSLNTDPHHQSPSPQQSSSQQSSTNRNRRSSRFVLDLHRLRHASIEERIEILRRHRSHQQERGAEGGEGEGAGEERAGRAGLAERLRERFHIRTRAAGEREST